jgi:hypothetical protein
MQKAKTEPEKRITLGNEGFSWPNVVEWMQGLPWTMMSVIGVVSEYD